MKDTQTRKLNMGIATLEGLNTTESDAIISTNPAAVDKRDELEANIVAIEQADEGQQASSSGGEAISKEEAKHNLADEADIIAQALCGYAIDHNDHTLYELMNKRAPAIFRMKDTDCLAFCHLVKDKASPIIADLATYNVTPPMVNTDLPALMEAFANSDAAPRNAQGDHHTATTNVSLGIVAMLKTLAWWDHFVGTLRISKHDFYTNYKTWRKELNIGVRHIAIRSLVKDSITGTPLFKVKVSVATTTSTIRTQSGKTGKFRIMSLNPGVYTLTFEFPGYQPLTVPNVSVINGKITDLPAVNLVRI